jgi:hypothetical protein
MALQLNVTTGSGVPASASYTVVTRTNCFLDSDSSTGYYCDATANLYFSASAYSAGSEPLDTFNWRFEVVLNPADRPAGLLSQVEDNLITKTTVGGVALPGSTKNVHKTRSFNFTGATKV